MTGTALAVIADLIVALAVIVSATVLLALSKIDPQTAMALYTAGIAMISGGTKAALALKVPTAAERTGPQS